MARRMSIVKDVMAEDMKNAQAVREICARKKILMVNIIGSPGAGKTTLLERSLRDAPFRSAVIEGDLATSRDAERIAACGVQSVQINTHGGCHLEAHLVLRAMEALELDRVDVLVVENVGNLVCPAEFDLGEDFKIAISSVPEGADKPLKYPSLFSLAECVVLTKTDLLPYIPFDEELFWRDVKSLNGGAVNMRVDSLSGFGINEWVGYLGGKLMEKR